MINHEFNEKRTGLANAFAAAGAELLGYMGSSSALAAIPDTDPPKYVAAGPLKEIAKLLPAFGDAAEQPTGDLTDEQIIKMHDAVFGWLDDGYKFVLRFARDIERAAIAAHLAGQSQATKVQAVPSLIEHDDWKIDGSLLYRLNDAGNANFDEINVTMANGSRKDDVRHKAALELLAGLAAPTAQEVTQQAAKAETAEQANELMRKALEDIAQPANAGCGCSFPCRCNDDGAEAINAGVMRDIASDTLAEVERLCCAQREEKNTESSDLAPTTSTVSAPDDAQKGSSHE